jgi:hypothetical protein
MIKLLSAVALLASLIMTAPINAIAQAGPCTADTVKIVWSGFTTPPAPSTLLPFNVELRIQNTGSGTVVTRSTGVSNASGSTSWYEGYTHQVTQIKITNNFGVGLIDPWDGSPQVIPSGVAGWCYQVSWNTAACPITITISPVRC